MASAEFTRVLETERRLSEVMQFGADLAVVRERFPATNPFPVAEDLVIEHDLAGEIPIEIITPPEVDADRTIVYWHQGAFIMGAAAEFTGPLGELGRRSRARVIVPDYRLAPEHPHPAAVDDARAAWRWAREQGADPARTVFAGDSAGGNLTVASLLAVRDAGDPRPAAAVCLSSFLDMEVRGATFTTNAERDPLISRDACEQAAVAYLGGLSPRTPLASPLWADLTGLPPLYISSGTHETLYDDAVRLCAHAARDGVEVTFVPAEEMVHMWYLYVHFLPEAQASQDKIAAFVRRWTPVGDRHSPAAMA